MTTKDAWVLRKQRYGASGCRDPSKLAYWKNKKQPKEANVKRAKSVSAWYSDPKNLSKFLKAHHKAHLGKPRTPETREKISLAQKHYHNSLQNEFKKGHPVPESIRKKISETKKGIIPWMKGKKHTVESRIKVSQTKKQSPKTPRGSNHPMWRGGSIDRGNLRVNGLLHRLWREQILQRDNFTCQRCEENNRKKLITHHIIPFRVSHDNSLENGITLCRSCHPSIESQVTQIGGTE